MRTPHRSGTEPLDIVPLTIVTQDFPARPSALPTVRDFVRRQLADTPMSDDEVRTLCDRVAEVLLDAAGGNASIQVSLRIFPQYAEVDVLFSDADVEPRAAVRAIQRSEPRDPGVLPAADVPAAQLAPVSGPGVGTGGGPGEAVAADRPAAAPLTFAKWLAAALRREGLTMEAAARRLDVSAKTVSRWIGGTTEPRLRDLARIRDAFGDPPLP